MELGIMHAAGNGVPSTTSCHMPSMLLTPTESSSAFMLPDAFFPLHTVLDVGSPPAQVMTDEQLETLRRQISVYATICQQLVEMHKATMAQQSTLSGSRFGPLSSGDSGLYPLGQKFASRQRWTPSQRQLQILEKLFQQGNGTPTKQRIKEISMELSQYGPISETNVYNWFQNRRARTKRKQQLEGFIGESEQDTDIDSHEEKRARVGKDSQANSQKLEGVEHQTFNTLQNGLQSCQEQAVVEKYALPFCSVDAAAMLDIKPVLPKESILREHKDVEMTNQSIEVMSLLQNANEYSMLE